MIQQVVAMQQRDRARAAERVAPIRAAPGGRPWHPPDSAGRGDAGPPAAGLRAVAREA